MDDEQLPDDFPDDLSRPQIREWIEEVRSEMDGAPRSERIEGEVLQRVLHRIDDLPGLPVETRVRLIEASREVIQHLL